MDIKNYNTISSSKYDIYTKFLDLAASGNYVTPLSNFNNVDFLKSGLFGYVTESLAMVARDSAFHKTMVYRENFLNTAIMPKSIYNWAKMFNVNTINAVPAGKIVTFTIDVNSLNKLIETASTNVATDQVKYGIQENGSFVVLDKMNPIIAGGYYFSLEHSIEIYRNSANKYIVKYCLNEIDVTTSFGTYSAIITSQYKTVDGTDYLVFEAKAYQYKIVEKSKIITSSSFLDNRIHKFEYTGQLCGLSLMYKKQNSSENVELSFSNLDTSEDDVSTTKKAYYNLADEGVIEINFASNKLSGLPQAGGQLVLRTFITEGSSGNISFIGDAVYIISQNDYRSLVITVSFDNTILSSGIDQSSLQDLKNTIINRLSSRNTIITENDLNNWFKIQSSLLEDANNSQITFRKEKDNLIKRTFGSYLLLRDGLNLDNSAKASSTYLSNVIPTNTINICYTNNNSDSDTNIIVIDPSTEFLYSNTLGYYINNNTIESAYKYTCPFHIYLNTKYNNVSYIFSDANDASAVTISEIKELSNIMISPSSLSVFHYTDHNDAENKYTFTLSVSSDVDLSKAIITNLVLNFSNAFSQKIDTAKFVAVNPESNETIKEYTLDIVATLDANKLFDFSNEQATMALLFNDNRDSVKLFEKTKINVSIAGSIGSASIFDLQLESEAKLNIFTTLDDVMSSDLQIEKDSTNHIFSYIIKNVPVIASYWMNSDINKEWFIKQILIFINMLKENTSHLETTTFFNLKFKNTYGISKFYSSLSTALRLKLTIYLKIDTIKSYNTSGTTSDDIVTAMKKEIIDFIRVLVDKSNDEGALVISKIIMKTQAAYYDFIDHIEFNGLNGTFQQYIKKLSLSDSDNQKYPLEYFVLDTSLDTDNTPIIEKDITFENVEQ